MAAPKICQLSSVHFAFDTRICQKEARSLAQAGFAVTIIARQDSTDQKAEEICVLPLPPPGNRLHRLLLVLRLGELAWRQRADLYAVHDPELLPVAVVLKYLTRARIVYDVHENVPRQILAKEWLPRLLRPLCAALYLLVERGLLPFVDGLVLAEESYEKLYARRRRQTVLNYPLASYISLAEAPPPQAPARPTLVYAGTITAIRGLFEMLELIRYLKPFYPDILLRLAGPVSIEGESRQVRERIAAADIEENVVLTGRISHREIHCQIAAADIGLALLHPEPNYVESLPTKLFEYMMMGKPVLVSDFPLWKRIVGGAGCGYALNPLDVPAIGQAAHRLLADPALRAEMGQRGREAVLQQYNWQTQAALLVRFYRALLERPGP